jgi:hypothetical protein
MAILYVQRVGEGDGRISLDKLRRQWKTVWEVETSSADVDSLEVALAPGLPRIGDYYVAGGTFDLGSIVVDIIPKRLDPDVPTLWTVEVVYQSQTKDPSKQSGGGGGGGQPGQPQASNPLLRPPSVDWQTRYRTVARLTTVDELPRSQKRPIANSAGTPYDPPPTEQEPMRVLTFRRNESTFRPYQTLLYIWRVNNDVFQGYPAYTVLCENIVGTEQYENSVRYWDVTYTFLFADHHDTELLDKGPNYLTEDNGDGRKPKEFRDSTGRPIGDQLLDGNGNPLPRNPVTGKYTGEPVNLRFETKLSARFADLNIPNLGAS